MAQFQFADRIQDGSTTTGTGTFTLTNTAADGYRTFASTLNTGVTVAYLATDDNDNWEVGTGVYSSTGPSLTRVTVWASSNAGAAVNWAAGSKVISVVHPAQMMNGLAFNSSRTLTSSGSYRFPDVSSTATMAMGKNAVANGLDAVSLSGQATGDYAMAMGANTNTEATGTSTSALGSYARATANYATALGHGSVASGTGAIAIGSTTTAGNYAVGIGGSFSTTGTGNSGYCARTGGYYGSAHVSFSDAYGLGEQGATRMEVGMVVTTTNATPAVLTLGNNTATYGRVTFAANTTVAFTGTVIGRSSTNSKAVEIKGVFKTNGSGEPALVGSSPAQVTLGEDAGASAWTVAVTMNTTNDCFDITVTGAAATTINWSADIQFHERT